MIAAISLTLGDYGVLVGILVTLVAWPTRSMLKRLEAMDLRVAKSEEAMSDRVGKIEMDLGEMRERKVDKTEWVRADLMTRAKIDRLLEGQAELSGKIDANFGVGAAVNRLADGIQRIAENRGE